MRSLAIALALAGCSFDRSGVGGDGGSRPDATIADGAVTDAPDGSTSGCVPWTAPNVDPCDPSLPTPAALSLDASRHTYDTDTFVMTGVATQPPHAVRTQTNGPDVTVLDVTSFDLAQTGTLTVQGSRPLVVIVHGSASIDGTLDVSAQVAADGTTSPGAGGDDASVCTMSTGASGDPATQLTAGGGGAGGGGFGDTGGDGSDGNAGGHGTHGAKGKASGNTMQVPLRGGCAGGKGGDDADATVDDGGPGGEGGGAIEITALGSIDVAGTIVAGGNGGGAGKVGFTGGGGGGSGGGILLDAAAVVVTGSGALCANGGGGGEGNGLGSAQDGTGASCGTLSAGGGMTDATGGDGGDGGVLGATAGTGAGAATNGAGGGGGGGGVGRIRVHGRSSATIDPSAIVSPAAS